MMLCGFRVYVFYIGGFGSGGWVGCRGCMFRVFKVDTSILQG